MPMPQPDTKFPPPPCDKAYDDIAEWAKWWVGTSSDLQNYHSQGRKAGQARRGFIDKAKDFFSTDTGQGATATASATTSIVMHLPVAADIFQQSAKLLYAYPPMFKPAAVVSLEKAVDEETGEELPTGKVIEQVDKKAQDRLDDLMNGDRAAAALLAHAEATAALGGGVLRCVWDEELAPDGPWFEHVDADLCLPTFTWSRLTDVLFWTDYPDGDDWYRHFELYVPGGIEHALYKGTKDNVGWPVSLNEHPATEDLADDFEQLPNGNYGKATGFDGLACVYVPNRRPNPAWRRSQKLKMWGASDIANDVIPLLAAIDEVWSSLMRDVRQGKGRLIVSDSLVNTLGAGKGSWIDADAEYIERVQDGMGQNDQAMVEQVQFAIREGAHLTVIEAILREVLRRVGISPLTFGVQSEGVSAVTATEITSHTRDSVTTTLAKRRLATPELTDLAEALMAIDAEHFGGPGCDEIDVIWPPEVQVSDEEKARTLTMLTDYISLYEAVKYLHPNWDEEQVQAEMALIREDKKAAMPAVDPFGFTEGQADEGSDRPSADEGERSGANPSSAADTGAAPGTGSNR